MQDKVYLPMEPNQQKELRYAMETQFRYKFYNSPEFPFLPSMGIRHVFQGFEHQEEFGFIGMLHLWWTNEDSGIEYDNPRYSVKGMWHGEWFDRPEEGIQKAIQIQKEVIWDGYKLLQVHQKFHDELRKGETNKEIEKFIKETEEEEMNNPKLKKKPVLN